MTTPPKYDEATELAVRNRVIAEMEADDRAAAHARHGRREVEFWVATARRLGQLDQPRLDPDERRQQRVFDDAAPLLEAADAAPVCRELAELEAMWGGEYGPWNRWRLSSIAKTNRRGPDDSPSPGSSSGARRLARHESAHAVAVYLAGRELEFVRVEPDGANGRYLASWCQDRDASIEELLPDLVALLVAGELDKRSIPPGFGASDEDAETALEICRTHNFAQNDREADALYELARARAESPAFQRLVGQLIDPLLEAGELGNDDVRAILEGDTNAT